MGSDKVTFSNFTPWSYFSKVKIPKFSQTKGILTIPFQLLLK
jgi:hypothetical protein